jgi:hypothetical protein
MIFKIKNENHSLFSSEIIIYADSEVQKYLNNDYDIYSGQFKSLFSGDTTVKFKGFDEIDYELLTDEPQFQLVGNVKDMQSFKSELADIYAGAYPKKDGFDSRKQNRVTVISIWAVYIAISVCFTLYETLNLKKENFIRITLGENLLYLWVKYIISNILCMCLFYSTSVIIGLSVYNTIFMFKYSLGMFAIFLAFNFFISMNLLIYDKNKVLANSYVSSFLLSFSKFIKCVIIAANVICMSTSLSLIYECYSFYKQRDFYINYEDYCVLQNIRLNNSEGDSFESEGKLYKELCDKLSIFYLCERQSIPSSEEKVIIANKNTISYLIQCIPELQNYNLTDDVYILHNADTELTDHDKEILSPSGVSTVSELLYNSNVDIVALNLDSDNNFTVQKRNPVIVYYNKDFSELYDDYDMLSMEVPIVYCLIKQNDAISKFMNENGLSCSQTNVMDIFNQKWIKLKRTLYISTILTILVLIMQIIVIGSIIRLEFSVNAIKLSIEKVLGYSIYQRFIAHYITTVVIYSISLIATVIISINIEIGVPQYMIYGSFFTYLLDNILFTLYVKKYENENIQRILKGGNL